MNMLTISPIRAFSDNYIWLIVRNKQAFVVDLSLIHISEPTRPY